MVKYWLCEPRNNRMIKCEEHTEDMTDVVTSSKGASNEQRWMALPEATDWTNCQIDEDLTDPDAPIYTLIADNTKTNQCWVELRTKRLECLKASDWTQQADCSEVAQTITDYVTYRQYLKDIPANEASADMTPDDFDTWLAAQ